VSPETRERQKAAKRANKYRERIRLGGKLDRDERRWFDKYERHVKPGRPRKDAPTELPPKFVREGDAPTVPVEIHHLGELRALPAHVEEPRTDEKQAPTDEKQDAAPSVSGVVLCKVCGRAEPCAVHPRGAEPFAPAVDVPDPNAANGAAGASSDGEKKKQGRGPGFEGRMAGLVQMGAAFMKGAAAELRAAGKWWAPPDEFIDELWVPHAEYTTSQLASAAQKFLGVSDEVVSGVVTFGAPVGMYFAVASVRADEEDKKKAGAPQQPRAAEAPKQAPPASASASPAPAPTPAAPANGANGAARPHATIVETGDVVSVEEMGSGAGRAS
jgi:hypothetical protein